MDESCMFSCHNSDLKLLLQVVDERWICIVVSTVGSSATRWWIWGVCWTWLKVVSAGGFLLLDDESDESAEYGWKSIRLERYIKYISYIFLPALFIDLSSSEIQCIQWMEIQWMEIGFICCKIWVFKSSTLDGTNLTMWLNVSMSNIARSCWLSGR